MRMSVHRAEFAIAGSLLLSGAIVIAAATRFSDYTPLTSSAGPVALIDEVTPITFGNSEFHQQSIADRLTQLAGNKPNSGNWDMITVNETGAHKGRYLFTVFETGQSGVQRQDLYTARRFHSAISATDIRQTKIPAHWEDVTGSRQISLASPTVATG